MWWRRKRERDLERELRAHLELEAEERSDTYAARRALGNVGAIKEETREAWGWMWLERLGQDVRYAARVLRKSPGFTAVAVLSLALGIGANTALFSLLDAVFWKSLPVRDPRELRILTYERAPKAWAPMRIHTGGFPGSRELDNSFPYPVYQALRQLPQFSNVVAYYPYTFNVTASGTTDAAWGQYISGNYFSGLGVLPLAGRVLLPDDDAPNRPGAVVLTYEYWERRFGLDPKVIGSKIEIDREPMTVAGVLPPEFEGLYPGLAVDLFVPLSRVLASPPYWLAPSAPDAWWLQIFARLPVDVPESAARQAVAATLAQHIESYAGGPPPDAHYPRVELVAGERGIPSQVFGSRDGLLIAVALVILLMACVNLANLLLARCAARTREMAARLSLGAGRARLMRQLLTESLLLAALGGSLGWAVAKPLLGVLVRLENGPSLSTLYAHLDARTLVFTTAVSMMTCMLAGLYPAWRATQVDLNFALKEGSRLHRVGRGWGAAPLVSVQVTLSLLMLIGAGLLVRTVQHLLAVDLGFPTETVLTFQTDATAAGTAKGHFAEAYDRLQQRLQGVPGVIAAGFSENGLLRGVYSNRFYRISGEAAGVSHNVNFMRCSVSFLSTMQIPILAGRDLSPTDSADSPPVVVVNETFVKRYLDGRNPVGLLLYPRELTPDRSDSEPLIIVGVARDAHYTGVRAAVPPTAYIPYTQHKGDGWANFVIRTALQPASLGMAVRRAVAEVESSLPVTSLATMNEVAARSTSTERSFAELVSICGLLEALLAAIGLYGVLAFTVVRRMPEIGIRVALGATGGRVQWLILRQSAVMVMAGLIAGVPLALALTRYIRAMLYGVAPNDLWSFAAAVLLMAGVGAIAAWIPARRASRVDPMTALRSE